MKQTVRRLLLALLLLSAAVTHAAVNFSLFPAARSGVGSNTVMFAGSLTNTDTTNAFLNQIQFAFTGQATNYLTGDTNSFYANVPGILLPSENYTDAVFAINVSTLTPPGSYAGTATVLGGTNIFGSNILAAQSFQVLLTATPLELQRSGTNLFLTWPAPPTNFTVQGITNLIGTNWVTLTNVPLVTNGANQVTLPLSATNRYFRLSYP